MLKYRAAIWVTSDGQGELRLTSADQHDLPDTELLAIGKQEMEFMEADMSPALGRIIIGEWQE
jgi:hypothetical protein